MTSPFKPLFDLFHRVNPFKRKHGKTSKRYRPITAAVHLHRKTKP